MIRSIPAVLISFVFIRFTLAGPAPPTDERTPCTRASQSLNGVWSLLVSPETERPPSEQRNPWHDIDVPAPWDNPSARGWYRRWFELERPGWPGRIFLRFEQVNYEATLFLNKRQVGYHRDGYLPFEVEITDTVIRSGTNDLTILVHDETCLKTDHGVVGPDKSLDHERGIVGDVSLLYRPVITISDVFVVPSVRKESIRIEVTIDNGGPTKFVTLETRFPGERTAPELSSKTVVGTHDDALVVMAGRWQDPELWWPHHPHLMTAETRLLDQKGNLLDQTVTRFGFREFAVSGSRFSLNGIPMNIFGSGLHWRPDEWSDPHTVYRTACEANVNALRLHARPRPRVWYDVADEMGMMLIDESALYGSHASFPFDDETFWRAAENHVAGLVRRDRNHPSVVIWSISNEMGWKDEGAVSFERLEEIVSHVRALDDSRPIMAEGDGDLDGRLGIANWHYVEEYPGSWVPRDAYWPERLSEWGRREDTAEGFLERPIYLGEFSSLWNDTPGVLAGYAGDGLYADYWAGPRPSRLRYHAELLRLYVGAYRWCRIAGIAPWTLFETGPTPNAYTRAHREAFAPLQLLVRERTSRFFGGSVARRSAAVCNDTFRPQLVEVQFHLLDNGNSVWTSSERARIQPAAMHRWDLAIPMPNVDQGRNLTGDYRLMVGDRLVDQVTATYSVLPDSFVLGFEAPVASAAVYEKGATVSAILSRLGVSTKPLTDLREVKNPGPSVLVIGPHSVEQPTGPWRESVADFANRGGLVVALQQHVPALWAPERVLLSTEDRHKPIPRRPDDRIDSRNHIRAPWHPLFAFLRSEQFWFWNEDHVVSRYGFWKPTRGYRTLLDVGQRLDQATLLEMPYGRGWIRLCQLDLTDKFDTEPMARLMFHRLLRTPEMSLVRAGVVHGATDRFTPFLRAQGMRAVRHVRNLRPGNVADLDVLLIDLLSKPTIRRSELESFLRRGGNVLLTGLVPETADRLRHVCGINLSAREGSQVVKRSRDPLLDGISNADLYWVWQHFTTEPRRSVTLYRACLDTEELHPLTSPAILAVRAIGRGKLVVDSSLWLDKWRSVSKAERLGGTLLLNLGLRVQVPYWDRANEHPGRNRR